MWYLNSRNWRPAATVGKKKKVAGQIGTIKKKNGQVLKTDEW